MKKQNTRIDYLYRDGSNYKTGRSVVLKGALTERERRQIQDHLDGGEFFIPGQVGLPDLQPAMINFPGEDDHPWHELLHMELTSDPPTLEDSVRDFAYRMAHVMWDQSWHERLPKGPTAEEYRLKAEAALAAINAAERAPGEAILARMAEEAEDDPAPGR